VHLFGLNAPLGYVRREDRRTCQPETRREAALAATTIGAEAGKKNHDRWFLAHRQPEHKFRRRRASSRLPALVDLVLARPIVSAGMIAAELQVTPRAAQNTVAGSMREPSRPICLHSRLTRESGSKEEECCIRRMSAIPFLGNIPTVKLVL